ncbi:MAG TPA: VapC toxin family PIN domain ribonuclease, partial [Thermoanaerobaculia bacterium]
FLRIEVTEPVYRRAGDLAERHALRGFDSLHLASYLALDSRRASGEPVIFSSFDENLNRAAKGA